jgi:hypothetical protein
MNFVTGMIMPDHWIRNMHRQITMTYGDIVQIGKLLLLMMTIEISIVPWSGIAMVATTTSGQMSKFHL